MTKEQKHKSKFRQTSKWKNWRKYLKGKRKVDAVTGKPLLKGWNLHHCDMNDAHYENLVEDNFECLNKASHEMIHWLFRYKNWRELLTNIYRILEKMEKLNSN